jgi:hypothetical protein
MPKSFPEGRLHITPRASGGKVRAGGGSPGMNPVRTTPIYNRKSSAMPLTLALSPYEGLSSRPRGESSVCRLERSGLIRPYLALRRFCGYQGRGFGDGQATRAINGVLMGNWSAVKRGVNTPQTETSNSKIQTPKRLEAAW